MNSSSFSLLQTAISAIVSVSVVALGHFFTISRDRANRRKEQRVAYLIEAYRAFAQANHHPRLYEIAGSLEQAVADLQLFGTRDQAALARRFAKDLGTHKAADIDELLFELRNSLRCELDVEPIRDRITWLRIGRQDKSAPSAD